MGADKVISRGKTDRAQGRADFESSSEAEKSHFLSSSQECLDAKASFQHFPVPVVAPFVPPQLRI